MFPFSCSRFPTTFGLIGFEYFEPNESDLIIIEVMRERGGRGKDEHRRRKTPNKRIELFRMFAVAGVACLNCLF